jgi:hypothetical protein
MFRIFQSLNFIHFMDENLVSDFEIGKLVIHYKIHLFEIFYEVILRKIFSQIIKKIHLYRLS